MAGMNIHFNVDSKCLNKFPNSDCITIETVEGLEDQFDFNEMVSLVFLLYDDFDTALCRLSVAQISKSNIGLLKNWVLSAQSKNEHWKDLFLEVLCITQCYSVLRKLGFTKNETNGRFLPFNEYTSLFVNPVRKALYRLCENLTDDQSMLFLSYVKEDFLTKPNCCFKDFHDLYLEMYLLHWFTIKYVILSEDTVNLDNIFKVLKVIEMEDFKDTLSSVVYDYNKKFILKDVNNINKNTESSMFNANKSYLHSSNLSRCYENDFQLKCDLDLNLMDTKDKKLSDKYFQYNISDTSENINRSTIGIKDQFYDIDKNYIGVCIIINQMKFTENKDPLFQDSLAKYDLEEREGSDIDAENLKTTWGDLGFTVKTFNDIRHYQIIPVIKNAIEKNFTVKHGCLVICILSHGDKDVIYGSDSVYLHVSEIENSLYDTRLNLLGKPKILIIQACQGKPCQIAVPIDVNATAKSNVYNLTTDGPSDKIVSNNTIPEFADLLVYWSTVPGFASVRDKKKGTWFINALCDVLQQDSKNKHFLDILQSVATEVSSKRWKLNGVVQCMVPFLKVTFTKKLYFP